MGKAHLFSRRIVIGWLAAAGLLLAIQLTGWADSKSQPLPCAKPNINTVLCINPTDGVGACAGIPIGQCSGKKVYTIKNFPNGSVPAATGATKQVQDDCYKYTTCKWVVGQGCVSGTTFPGGNVWYQGAKTVVNPDVTCP